MWRVKYRHITQTITTGFLCYKEPKVRRRRNQPELQRLLPALEKVVTQVGRRVLAYKGPIPVDTDVVRGHEESSIDNYARQAMQEALDQHLPNVHGIVRFELRPYSKTLLDSTGTFRYALIIDEIEGTTNTKRCLASGMQYQPQAGVSLAVSLSESLEDLVASSFYAMHSDSTYSAIATSEDAFMSFRDGCRIDPESVCETKGDSRTRVFVIGYSNSHRLKKGELEQAIWDAGLKPYEGCRASGIDVINIIRNQADAYIDIRRCWSTLDDSGVEKEAQLQCYDIAGVLPIALGCGLDVSDPTGGSWKRFGLMDAMPLIVSRPSVTKRLLEIVSPLAQKWLTAAETTEKSSGTGSRRRKR